VTGSWWLVTREEIMQHEEADHRVLEAAERYSASQATCRRAPDPRDAAVRRRQLARRGGSAAGCAGNDVNAASASP
jgi:hypothetical protein